MSTKTINIAIDDTLLKNIDQVVMADMGSRSEYFRRLALNDLARRREWNRVLDISNKKGRELGIKSEKQVYDILDEYKSKK